VNDECRGHEPLATSVARASARRRNTQLRQNQPTRSSGKCAKLNEKSRKKTHRQGVGQMRKTGK
jgi:hypothetical protein